MRNIAVAHFLFGLIENALCYLQVGVKKAVHPIRFASDSRIALLAAVSNPPGSDRLSAQAGTILHKVQSVPAAAPFLVSVARTPPATIRIVLSPPRARGRGINRRRTPTLQKMMSEAHCPNVLTVYYFKTSSGGIPAPSGSIPCRRSVTSVDGRLRRKPNFCGVHSLRLYGAIGWLMIPKVLRVAVVVLAAERLRHAIGVVSQRTCVRPCAS